MEFLRKSWQSLFLAIGVIYKKPPVVIRRLGEILVRELKRRFPERRADHAEGMEC